MYKIVNDIQNVNNAKKESMSYEVYRSCEGEDHILVSDILRDHRLPHRGFRLSNHIYISPIQPTFWLKKTTHLG